MMHALSHSDTAGIRESVDPIEQEGVRRALNRSGYLYCDQCSLTMHREPRLLVDQCSDTGTCGHH